MGQIPLLRGASPSASQNYVQAQKYIRLLASHIGAHHTYKRTSERVSLLCDCLNFPGCEFGHELDECRAELSRPYTRTRIHARTQASQHFTSGGRVRVEGGMLTRVCELVFPWIVVVCTDLPSHQRRLRLRRRREEQQRVCVSEHIFVYRLPMHVR